MEKHLNIVDSVQRHETVLIDHDKRIKELEVKEAVLGAKLDTTNKLLAGILGILATAVVGILFEILKNGGIK